jgi:hypothetical protein
MVDEHPTSIRLPSVLREELQRLATAEDRSLNNYILRVLKEHVEKVGRAGSGKKAAKPAKP